MEHIDPHVLSKHTDTIRSLAFSPDGSLLASLSMQNDKRVILWNTATWTPVQQFYSGAGTTMLWFSPDGALLIGTGVNKEIYLWWVATGVEQVISTVNINGRIRFPTTDKPYLVACHGDELLLYDLMTQDIHARFLLPHSYSILFGHCAWINKTATLCAIEDSDHSVILWSLDSLQMQMRLVYHQNHIMDIDFHVNKPWLGSVSDDGTITIWDIHRAILLQTMLSTAPNIFGVVFHPQKPVCAIVNSEDYIELWDIENKTIYRQLYGHGGQITIAFSPDGKFLASGSDDNQIRIWLV